MVEGDVEMLRRCVVVGGGAVGGMFSGLLAGAGAEVSVIDVKESPPGALSSANRFRCGDITAPDHQVLEELSKADLVLLAVPERVALAALAPLAGVLKPATLLADTLSVKSRIAAAVRAAAPQTEAVSLNPMFAPSLGIVGRPVIAAVLHDGPRARELLRLLSTWGGQVVTVDVGRHDRLVAAGQALTHSAVLAFGSALVGLNVDIEQLSAIAPPPHSMMLALLARISSGTPEVYWDVQSGNPHAPEAREALASGVRRLVDITEKGNEAGFAEILGQMRDFLGGELEMCQRLCARTFDLLPSMWSAVGCGSDPADGHGDESAPEGALGALRAELNRIDERLLDALRQRLECCERIAWHKREHAIPMMQPHRINLVQERASRYAALHGIDSEFLRRLYTLIIGETCRVEDAIIDGGVASPLHRDPLQSPELALE